MTAERDPVDAVDDILRNLALAREFVGEALTVDELEADPKTLYSVVRALEVVGEATKRVPASVRDNRFRHPLEGDGRDVEPRVRALLEHLTDDAEPPHP